MPLSYIIKEKIIEKLYETPEISISKLAKQIKISYPTTFRYISGLVKVKFVIKKQISIKKSRISLSPVLKNEMDWLYFVRERYRLTKKLEAPPKLI